MELTAGDPGLAAWLEEIAPFLTEQAADFTVQVDLRVGLSGEKVPETGTPSAGSFVHHRPDLHFEIDAERRQAKAWVDGCRGGFEAVVQLCLQSALLVRGGVVVHASAGVLKGEGWLMPGKSGDGKSTAAREGGFDAVLSDEMVVACPGVDDVRLYGTPFWSEGRSMPLHPGSAPMAVLARLVKAPQIGIDPLGASAAVAHLLRCVTLYERSETARAMAFEAVCNIVERTRCVALRFPKEGPWASAAKSLI